MPLLDGHITKNTFRERLELLVGSDVNHLMGKQVSYEDSWKKRGGVGAFMMLARKIDRIENQTRLCGWDIFEAAKKFPEKDGILDDIRDLRRYLILVEDEISQQGLLK